MPELAVAPEWSGAALVVTSIAAPNDVLRSLAAGAAAHDHNFIVVGDAKTPTDFRIDGCAFYDVVAQRDSGFEYARLCPTGHYARKNVGYLLAIRAGAPVLVETDDDNLPRPGFWETRRRRHRVPLITDGGWLNVYGYFSDSGIWPRGLPLDAVRRPLPDIAGLPERDIDCPIQQGLADGNPDVDAIYRLVLPLPQTFRSDLRLALSAGSWCPFNSQNTTWFPEAYPLLYLPANCPFRMTDIWRSFVAQRIAWVNGWGVLFDGPTVEQRRNEHDLMRDFEDEIPGYLYNRRIARTLDALDLAPGRANIADNLRRCYRALVKETVIDAQELPLAEAWLGDLERLGVLD
ncbi:MAG: STELLO glycosyltransferase family protein [Alphaproteobacteria bacterium]